MKWHTRNFSPAGDRKERRLGCGFGTVRGLSESWCKRCYYDLNMFELVVNARKMFYHRYVELVFAHV